MCQRGTLNFLDMWSAGSCSVITPEILLHLGYACAFAAAVMTLIAVLTPVKARS